MGWRSFWGRRAGEGWRIGQRRSLVQTKHKWLRGAWEFKPHHTVEPGFPAEPDILLLEGM